MSTTAEPKKFIAYSESARPTGPYATKAAAEAAAEANAAKAGGTWFAMESGKFFKAGLAPIESGDTVAA
jgi:hypothetical protein